MTSYISTRNLRALPKSSTLKKVCQSVAMLDAILEPEWEYRYYSFNSKWDAEEEMASMRDGSGDDYFILFKPQGTIIKGFAHESPMGIYSIETGDPWPGVLNDVPTEFADFLTEPAFGIDEISFCIWCQPPDSFWSIGNIPFPESDDPDGSARLLFMLDGSPSTYLRWAEKYYERKLPLDIIESVYQHQPLVARDVAKLNPHVSIDSLKDDALEIGYPFEGSKSAA